MSNPSSSLARDATSQHDPGLVAVLRLRYWQHLLNEMLKQKLFKIPIHLAFGHEAAAVAMRETMSSDDRLCLSHRNAAYNLARSETLDRVLGHYQLTERTSAGGLMGSMNLAVEDTPIVYSSSILGNNVSVATGIAMHRTLVKQPGVVFVCTGDGGMEEGAFWETLVFSRSHRLPLVVVVENNDFSMSSTIEQRRSSVDLSHVCAGVGYGYIKGRGAVLDDVRSALGAARASAAAGTPTCVELDISTFCQHAGPTPGWPDDPLRIDITEGLLVEDSPDDPVYHIRKALGDDEFRELSKQIIEADPGEIVEHSARLLGRSVGVVESNGSQPSVRNPDNSKARAVLQWAPRIDVDPQAVRRTVLTMLHRTKASHLGSNMSVIEMLVAMYGSVDCGKIRNGAPDRSRVLVSKGHCAAATYATLAHFGIVPMSLLDTFHMDGSMLAGHVSHAVRGVEHSTGSLGHGLNVAVGCALGLRSRGHGDRLVLTLVGDGEIQEGSIWEGLMFAVHMKLRNFITLVDNNRISSITNTEKVIDMRPLTARFEGFGLNVREVDGHSVEAISAAIADLRMGESPGVIVCNTIKGRDVPFAEGQPMWHYKSLSDEQYAQAMAYLDDLGVER